MASLRSRPASAAELVDQEAFGSRLVVEATRGDWALCLGPKGGRSSRGWIPFRSLAPDARYNPHFVVIRRFAILRPRGSSPLVLPLGSLVEARGSSGRSVVAALPGGGTGRIARSALLPAGRGSRASRASREQLFAVIARAVVGVPYLWGGKTTYGYDCSGLVQAVFRLLGIDLPRNSYEQARIGMPVKDLAESRPLDLVFFAAGRRIDHVAIHTGGLGLLHASGSVRRESLDPASPVFREDLRRNLKAVRRIIAP